MTNPTTDPSPIRVEPNGATTVVTIDRNAARNAIDHATVDALVRTFSALETDPQCAVVVLTGSGDRAFSAGMDLKAFAADFTAGSTALVDSLCDFCRAPFPKPLIAAVNGAALAGGFELALKCDLIVAGAHATFGLPEVRRGLIAAAGGLVRLPARLPQAIALELILTGAPIDAQRALALGLVNRVVPPSTEVDTALALAAEISSNAPLAVRASKAVVGSTSGLSPDAAFDLSSAAAARVFATADALEGATAFAERREPRWYGR